jgi:hypothetical protein
MIGPQEFNPHLMIDARDNLGPELASELVELFVGELPKALARIDAGIRARSGREVVEGAHTIKGMSAQVGLEVLSEYGNVVLSMARIGELQHVPLLMPGMRGAADRGLTALRQFVQASRR